jgi:membrane associated rhomboid family serine protease
MRAYDSSQHPYFFGVTLAIVILNFIVFFHELSLGDQVDQYVQTYGFTPAKLSAALGSSSASDSTASPSVWTTFITSMFLHSGWEHILSNMLFLVLLGPRVEGRMGSWQYLIFYFLAGIIGSLTIYFANPASATPGIGASGAIAGVIGAALVTDPTAYVWMPPQLFVPVWFFGPFWFFSEFYMAAKAAQGDMVAHWVHVGGFCTGLIAGFLIRRNHAPAIVAKPVPQTLANLETPHLAAERAPEIAVAAPSLKAEHPGAPASPHPPISPRTAQEDAVHRATSKSIHKHKPIMVWIILAFAVLVTIGDWSQDGGGAIGVGVFTFLFLLGIWTGVEHLFAFVYHKLRANPPQNPTPTPAQ